MKSKSNRGFTLLEVLIAMAVLATALTVLMGTMANSNQQAIYSNKLTVVSQLARGKMIDLEYKLKEEEFPDSVLTERGDFGDQGYSNITWRAELQPVEIPDDVRQDLMARVNSQLFGGTDSQGALKGNAAFSSKLPMLMGLVPQMINQIGTKVRRINLVIEYDFGGDRQTMKLSQYVVDKSQAQFDIFGQSSGTGEMGEMDDGEL